MSSAPGTPQTIRRSCRQSRPTIRGKQYIDELVEPLRFPSVGEDIKVKWDVEGRIVWWPATVLSVQLCELRDKNTLGNLLYHKLGNYEPTQTNVMFSTSGSGQRQRFVTSVDTETSSEMSTPSSWVFSDEMGSDEEVIEAPSSGSTATDGRASDSYSRKEKGQSSPVPVNPKLRLRGRNVLRNGLQTPISKSPRTMQSSRKDSKVRTSSTAFNKAEMNEALTEPSPSTDNRKEESVLVEGVEREVKVEKDQRDVEIRLRLLERQLQDFKPGSESSINLSATAHSVIVSLRWALLRALEKPLKNMPLDELMQHGLAANKLVVSSQCDYFTFREIAAAIAKEHGCSDDCSKSRVAFSPSFNSTQAGSSASNNMNILFSCLADLGTFLFIRDESDYYSILIKEVLSESLNMLRIMGSFELEDTEEGTDYDTKGETNSGTVITNLTQSVSTLSHKSRTISLFIGSAPVKYVRSRDAEGQNISFRSTLLQQQCRHFSSSQNCYQEPWTLKHIESSFAAECTCHLNGTIEDKEMSKFLLMTWTAQIPPSSKKWTRDVHDVGNNLPGSIRLTLPYVFFSASRNVSSVTSLLDTEIETFMRVRSKMHTSSSFK